VVLVQAMAPPGLEMIVGMARDEVFGPIVVCGLGGARLLGGYRGLAARDVPALIASVVGVGELAAEIGDLVSELDLNPLLAGGPGEGCQAADALVVLSTRG
jgi:acetyltransferase